MIFKLFKLFRSYRDGKGREGTVDFVHDQAKDIILAPFWLALFTALALVIVSGAFAFFHIWGGPYGLARFLFWVLLPVSLLIIFSMRAIISRSKKIVKKVSDKI